MASIPETARRPEDSIILGERASPKFVQQLSQISARLLVALVRPHPQEHGPDHLPSVTPRPPGGRDHLENNLSGMQVLYGWLAEAGTQPRATARSFTKLSNTLGGRRCSLVRPSKEFVPNNSDEFPWGHGELARIAPAMVIRGWTWPAFVQAASVSPGSSTSRIAHRLSGFGRL
jgi:hypothetical protein